MTSGLDRRMKLPNLTTEPPLDPPEPVNLKAEVRRRDQRQADEMDEVTYNMLQELQEELNLIHRQQEDDEREWAIAQSEEKNTM